MATQRTVIAGGSGFLGRTLSTWFAASGREVIVLSRQGTDVPGARCVPWDGQSLGAWAGELDGAAALINLAGRSVNCRYTPANRRDMMDSRIRSTRVLGEAIARCAVPPPVWLNSSTATIYKHTYDAPHDEGGIIGATPEAKDAFSVEIARAWEAELDTSDVPNTRKVAMRAAMVFGREPGGVYTVLRRLVKFGLGGKMAHGRQFVSWIHERDFRRAIDWLIGNVSASGVYNICAPNPLTNSEMMATLRRVLGAPMGLPATRWMLECGAVFLRTETELIIKSRRVIPARLMEEGFVFELPTLDAAVAELERQRQALV